MHIFSHKLKMKNDEKVFQLEDIYHDSTWKQQGIHMDKLLVSKLCN